MTLLNTFLHNKANMADMESNSSGGSSSSRFLATTTGSETEDEENIMWLMMLWGLYKSTQAQKRKHKAKNSAYLKKRATHGEFALTKELSEDKFKNFFRMSRVQFQEILSLVAPLITGVGCNAQRPIPADEKLAIFLRYIATGETYKSLAYAFRIGDRTVSNIVISVSTALWKVLKPTYLPTPTLAKWKSIALDYEERWHFPHCVGALDGKHITIKKPPKSGSSYFNYKRNFSTVLLAICDARYKFTYIDVGSMGRFSDGGLFATSQLATMMEDGSLGLPNPEILSSFQDPLPYVLVADEAFPLMYNLMRPYPKVRITGNLENQIFNYRLSRARQTVECTFGILAARFRVFSKPFECKVTTVVKVVKAACVLHNYLRKNAELHGDSDYSEDLDNQPTSTSQLLSFSGCRTRSGKEACICRKKFNVYFNTVGSIPWQQDSVAQGNL